MKKKIIIVNVIVLLIVISSITIFSIRKNIKEQEANRRYAEIKESAKKGVEWNIRAAYPFCKISDNWDDDFTRMSYSNSTFYINNGYI